MLLGNKAMYALAMSAILITSCSKVQDFPGVQDRSMIAPDSKESIISSKSTSGLKAFAFTEIPSGSVDFVNPGRGVEQ